MKFLELLPVFLLAPVAFSAPSSHPQHLKNQTFHLSNLTYASTLLYSTPAHLAISSATFSFDFSNPAAYSAKCIAYSSGQTNDAGFFAFPQLFTCTNDGDADNKKGNVTFNWDRYGGGGLSVNQTSKHGGKVYLGTATASVDLQCQTTSWQNPNFTWPNPDGPYSTAYTKCNTLDLKVEASLVTLQ